MWTPITIIIIATIGGLLSLWRDELVSSQPTIPPEETDKEKSKRLEEEIKVEKTKRIKLISSIFTVLALCFTVHQIISSEKEKNKANKDKLLKSFQDSVKYVNQRRLDSMMHRKIDSMNSIQIEEYKAILYTGDLIDSLKAKSSAIIDNLSLVDHSVSMISPRYEIDSNISGTIVFGFWSSKMENEMMNYVKMPGKDTVDRYSGKKSNYVTVDQDFLYFDSIKKIFNTSNFKLSFYDPNYNKFAIFYTHEFQEDNLPYSMEYNGYHNNSTPMMLVSNKYTLTSGTSKYHKEKGIADNNFEITYDKTSRYFYCYCSTMQLRIINRREKFSSLLDFKEKCMVAEFANSHIYSTLSLDSCFMNCRLEFSDKMKSAAYRFVRPLPRRKSGGIIYTPASVNWPVFMITRIILEDY